MDLDLRIRALEAERLRRREPLPGEGDWPDDIAAAVRSSLWRVETGDPELLLRRQEAS